MRYLIVFLLVVFSVVFHSSVQPEISEHAILGDMPTLLTISVGLFLGPAFGAATGFITGLFLDLSLTSVVGVGILTYTITGYLAGILEQNLHAEDRVHLSVMIVVLTLLKYFINGLLFVLVGLGVKAIPFLLIGISPALVNGVLFFIFFYRFNTFAHERIDRI